MICDVCELVMLTSSLKLFVSLLILLCTAYSYTIEDNVRLKTDLFENYDREVRPPRNHSNALAVFVTYYLQAIIEVDDVRGVFKTFGGIQLMWTDERLMWDPGNYSGMEHIVVNLHRLWSPIVFTFNAVSTAFNSEVGNCPLRVYYNGSIQMINIDVIETSFSPDMTYFPFDRQICSILAAYLSHEVYLINLTNNVDTTFYSENNE